MASAYLTEVGTIPDDWYRLTNSGAAGGQGVQMSHDNDRFRGLRVPDSVRCILAYHGISYRRDGYRLASQYSMERMAWWIEARCERQDGGEAADQCIREYLAEDAAADKGYVAKVVFNMLLKLENFMVASEFFVNNRLYRNPFPDKINDDGSWK